MMKKLLLREKMKILKNYLNNPFDFTPGQKILIIGAGSSSLNLVEVNIDRYDHIITLNNASQVFPDASYHLFEINDFEQVDHMCDGISIKKSIFKVNKKFSKIATTSEFISRFGYDYNRLNYYKPSHRFGVSIVSHVTNYFPLFVQWCGSLSLLIDVCVKSKISEVGLIGTDFGGDYAVVPPWSTFNGSVHSLASNTVRGFDFFDVCSKLTKINYFDDIKFVHYHYSEELSNIL